MNQPIYVRLRNTASVMTGMALVYVVGYLLKFKDSADQNSHYEQVVFAFGVAFALWFSCWIAYIYKDNQSEK